MTSYPVGNKTSLSQKHTSQIKSLYITLSLTYLVQPLLCSVYSLHHLFCYQVNYIVCHYETFSVALKLAFGEA